MSPRLVTEGVRERAFKAPPMTAVEKRQFHLERMHVMQRDDLKRAHDDAQRELALVLRG